MQIGLYEVKSGWTDIEELTGETFSAGTTYQIQPRGRVIFQEAESEPASDNYDGIIADSADVVKYSPGTQALYIRAQTAASINISQLEA